MGTEMLHEQINEQERQERQEPNQPPRRRVRALRWVGARLREAPIPLLTGLLGSLAAIVVMGVLRLTVGTPTLPELLAERILLLLPASTFVDLLVRFQPNSKTAPLGLTLLGQFVIGILLGPLFALISGDSRGKRGFWPGRRAWLTAGIAVVVMEGVGLALFWPVLDAGLAGDSPDRARLLTSLAMLATFLAFVLVLLFANHRLHRAWAPQPRALAPAEPVQPTQPEQVTASDERAISRRAALGAAGVVVLAVAAGGLGIDRLIASYFARSNLAYEGMSNFDLAPITPNEHFYIVSKNVLDPQVDISRWQLEVKGLVNHPTTWHYDQLRALPAETRVVTFECIANNVGGHLISTAEWQGVLLQTVLDKAGGVQASGKYITFTSVDGYQYSLPLADLLEARTLLAWQMNGVPLPERHGYPLRAVVPGRYGEQSPKWLTRIEVVDQLYTGGLYQSQGWASTQVPTTGRINQPAGKVPRGTITVAGIAFAGIRGIQKVEVSADKGMNWHTATLTPPLSDQSWVFWQWPWTPSAPGTYTLLMRATDGTGALQTQTQRGTVPSGATGWPQVTVQIV